MYMLIHSLEMVNNPCKSSRECILRYVKSVVCTVYSSCYWILFESLIEYIMYFHGLGTMEQFTKTSFEWSLWHSCFTKNYKLAVTVNCVVCSLKHSVHVMAPCFSGGFRASTGRDCDDGSWHLHLRERWSILFFSAWMLFV